MLTLNIRTTFFLCLLVSAASCVRPKVYRSELTARQGAENREKVLVKELLDRKKEAADMINKIGELNRLIGQQEENISDLNTELSNRVQQMGESSSKLAAEKKAVEKDLASKNAELSEKNLLLGKIQTAQQQRRKKLEDLKASLAQSYASQADVAVELREDCVVLSLPDKALYDNKIFQEVSASGRALLSPLAQILSTMPEVDTEVHSHTDNILPKDKTLQDTWDWSLRRATNVVRTLIREFNVNANQLTPVAKGEYYPLTSNATVEGRIRNRRTEILLYPDVPAIPAAE